jgi:hypothetical protein
MNMTTTRFEQDGVDVPIVVQGVGGDLRLRGRPGDRLIVDGDNPQVQQIGEDQPFVVRCAGDARVTVPETVNVSVQQVGGDAKITDITGQVDIKTVGGDLAIRNVQDVQVKTVGGDLRIKRADGNVTVETVGADATIREVGGAVWVATVGSDLYVRNVGGSCVAERVGADLVLNIDFLPEHEYRFGAGSDILCRVQPDANVRFALPPEVDVQLDVAAEVTATDDQQAVTLGDGGILVHIERANSLRLVGEEEDYMLSLGVQIEEELEARMSSLEEKLSQHLAGLDDRFQAKAEQFASQAEKFARRAERQAERAAEQIRRSFDRQTVKRKREAGPRRRRFTVDSRAASRPSEPISEQERLMILQMVRDNKISIEEAERLLSALEK